MPIPPSAVTTLNSCDSNSSSDLPEPDVRSSMVGQGVGASVGQ